MRTSALLLITAVLAACEGPEGKPGEDGQDGVDGTDGTDGADGADGADGTDGTDGTDGVDGEDGKDWDDFPLEAAGVVGLVTDRAGEVLSGGTIYFVPTADVAALPATTVAVDSTNDEPLEDLIAAGGATYLQAEIGEDGVYSVPTLSDGTWFITYVPAEDDADHLPGGSLCREATTTAEIVGTRLDIEVSQATPEGATYVGSGACVGCHGKTEIAHTVHRNGIWSPYEYGPLQDPEEMDGFWEPLSDKFEAGQTIYYYGYDSSRSMDKYKTSETDPGSSAGVSFKVTLGYDEDGYSVTLTNVANPSDPSRTYRVDLVYGGGVYKQRYMTRIEGSGGDYYAMLPVQYQHTGSEDSSYGRTSKVWRDYNGGNWYSETTDTFTTPAATKSFEKNCISCHAVGVQVTGSDSSTWTAHTVEDRVWGDLDFDGNGYAEEVNLGCENCHGPGSAHWESTGQSKHIVSPELLTPERESVICGQCHSRPKGAYSTDSPVNAEGWMMVAGTSRNEFLSEYATSQLDGASTDYYADDALHSKSHHQQYSDFIRSGLYKNDEQLMTCSSCHDPHAKDNANQLRADPTDNDASCGGACHADLAADLEGHIDEALGTGLGGMMDDALCVECHMAKTAKTGAGEPGLELDDVQYWQNDVSSHIFDVPAKSWSDTSGQSMPTPYTDSCANSTCHNSLE